MLLCGDWILSKYTNKKELLPARTTNPNSKFRFSKYYFLWLLLLLLLFVTKQETTKNNNNNNVCCVILPTGLCCVCISSFKKSLHFFARFYLKATPNSIEMRQTEAPAIYTKNPQKVTMMKWNGAFIVPNSCDGTGSDK